MVTLNPIFSTHMVLQANKPVRLFGEGEGEVAVRFNGATYRAVAEDGWLMELPPMPYGGPHTLEVVLNGEGKVLEDVHFGDVYLLGGQSNMEFKLRVSSEPTERYAANENVRFFTVDRMEDTETYHARDGWIPLTRENAGCFSAIGYHVGQELAEPNRKIGLIGCYQGASVIQTWIPREVALKAEYRVEDKYRDHVKYPIWNGDGVLYDYMIKRILPYSMAGVLFYQGESNTSDSEAAIYFAMLTDLIESWRRAFRDASLPFTVVQIADYPPRMCDAWRAIQEVQLEAQKVVPFVNTVVSRDVCETDNIHPKTKKKLAQRIAALLK